MVLFRHKRGSMVLLMIFEILAVAMLIYVTLSIAKALGESDTVFKKSVAEDLRMMIDVLAGVPGDAVVRYPVDVSPLTFTLDSYDLSLYVKDDPGDLREVRNFFLPANYTAEGFVEGVASVCMEKRGKFIRLRECGANEFPALEALP